jgi:uncharacterized protein (DUF2342 family)
MEMTMKLKTMTGAMLGSAAATGSMTAGATGSYANDAMSSTDPAAAADALGLGTIAASASTG